MEEAVERIIQKTGTSTVNSRWNKYGRTKREVLENPEGLAFLREQLCPDQLAKFGHFTMSLKDELRDFEAGKPKDARVFMPVDLALLVATVMIYGNFNDKFVDAEFEGSPGIGFLHGGAHRLATRLLTRKHFGKGDAHKYDTLQNTLLRELVYDLREELIEQHPLGETVKRLLICPSFLLPSGVLWKVSGGNPSGSFNTLVDNSILTMLVLAYAMAREFGYVDWNVVVSIVTGDDYLYSTDLDSFTPSVVSLYARELGLDFDEGELTGFDQADFCQHKFILDGGVYVVVPVSSERMHCTMLLNRCDDLEDLAGMTQSLLIQCYYDKSSRVILRNFQEYLRNHYYVDMEYMTDNDIDRLHKSAVVNEYGPLNFRKLVLKDLSFRKESLRSPLSQTKSSITALNAANEAWLNYQRLQRWHHLGGFRDQDVEAQHHHHQHDQPRAAARAVASAVLPAAISAAAQVGVSKVRDYLSQLGKKAQAQSEDKVLRKESLKKLQGNLLSGVSEMPRLPVNGKARYTGQPNPRPASRPKPAPRAPRQGGSNQMVRAPVAQTLGQRRGTQRMKVNGTNLVITRREYIGDINGSTTEALTHYDIDSNQFPWAKSFSSLYESYKFEKCDFEYVPTSASSQTGFVILAPDYDPNDNSLITDGKAHFLNMKGAVAGPSWKNLLCHCAKADLNKRKTLYTGPSPGDTPSDLRGHSAGKLWMYVGAQSVNTAIGEIWVNYTIVFMTPQLLKPKPGSIAEEGSAARFVGTSNAAPYGTAPASGSIPATFVVSGTTTSSNTWTFTEGWQGYVYTKVSGTSIDLNIAGSGAEASIEFSQISTTDDILFAWVDVDQGETFQITIGNGGITAGLLYFVRGHDVRS